jgi:heat shock protein HslJ
VNRRAAARRALALLGAAILIAMLAGCAGARAGGGGTGHPQSITGKWQLVSGSDKDGSILPGNADVTFTFDGQTSGGHGPCNSFGAATTGTTTGAVTITIGIHTEIACVGTNPDPNTTEARYFTALDKVTTAAMTNGNLVLTGGGDSLQFTRAKK